MQITIPIYQRKEAGTLLWSTVGLGEFTRNYKGTNRLKLEQQLITELRALLENVAPAALPRFELKLGTNLERLRLELTLYGEHGRRKLTGLFPLILEPRWTTPDHKLFIAYHPSDQGAWFPVAEEGSLSAQATTFFQKKWADLEERELESKRSNEKDSLFLLSFNATPQSLLDSLPKRRTPGDETPEKEEDPKGRAALSALPKLGIDLSPRAASKLLPLGLPRSPYREQLQILLTGAKRKPTVLLGPSGVGKSTLRNRLVHDLLLADGYEAHRNLDRVTHAWLLNGKLLIAGMSYVGDWERRCLSLVEDARKRPALLIFEDLHLFGRLGRARDSERSFADFFRGPVSRGEILLLGEATHEQWQQLEEEAPSFAGLFSAVPVHPTDASETLRLLLAEARALEQRHDIAIGPYALRAVVELGTSLTPGSVAPGQSLELLRQLAKEEEGRGANEPLGELDVIGMLSRRTGLPSALLNQHERLSADELSTWMSERVIGQPVAVAAACDLVARIKAGLTDPKRPLAVYLLTGPTGTGKTELAKCIAAYLYQDPARLLRLDMGEFSGPDAASRLIGDRWAPEGILTRQVQEQPFCVVLFDEIEKAHTAVLHLLLQLFDEGRLTDAAGVTADFTRAVLLMTSNLGASPRSPSGFIEDAQGKALDIARAVRDFFPPELFNRIDRVLPFGPLSREVAAKVAEKELSRLLGRHGLTERGAFVQLTPTAREHITNAAFHPKDGARALKRAIEEQVGGLLVNELTAGAPGALRLYQLYQRNGALRLHGEVMREAPTVAGRYALEPLLEQPLALLKPHLPAARSVVEEILAGDAAAQLATRIRDMLYEHNLGRREHDDPLYYLEALRQDLGEFAARTEELLRIDDGVERLEADRFGSLTLQKRFNNPRTVRIFDRRALEPTTPILARTQALELLAEARFLRRLVRSVEDPRRHAVLIDISRIGTRTQQGPFSSDVPTLFAELVWAYSELRWEPEQTALLYASGKIESYLQENPAAKIAARHKMPTRVVFKIIGLGALDFFEEEEGCHLWQPMRASAEVVRVRVLPATQEPHEYLAAQRDAQTRFEEALATGDTETLPENPRGLLPLVRRLVFDLQSAQNETTPIEVEDYRLGYSAATRGLRLRDLMKRLSWLRMSREDQP